MRKRLLEEQIQDDLSKKMVFLSGPRQVGKTTLARKLLPQAEYLNWDVPRQREMILKQSWNFDKTGVILDEIHKWKSWRNFLKGLFDEWAKDLKILVTGSGRLDLYRRTGDSLQGRYFFHHLHPFTIQELRITKQSDFEDLFHLGSFPEPYLSGTKKSSKRWSRDYRTRILEEDLQSLENVQDLAKMEQLTLALPARVGSILSVNALREDLQVSHQTVDRWLQILNRLYFCFRIFPFRSKSFRSVQKESKLYLWNLIEIEDQAKRFENLIALHLMEWVSFRQDCFGEDWDLHFLRNRDGRELDFCLVHSGQPKYLIECKWKPTELDSSLRYFHSKFPEAEAWQIHFQEAALHKSYDRIVQCSALHFLNQLPRT